MIALGGLACIAGAANPPQSGSLPWRNVRSWAYWLDNPDLVQLGASRFDLLVIDPSADGSAARMFTAQQLERLRRAQPRRRVVAYLSIGQAEAYRGYWQRTWRPGLPEWLGTEDSAWPGNYWVKYWQPAWRAVLYRYLDAIIAAGFDGMYLDRVDAYQERSAGGHREDMVRLVTDLARYARAHASGGADFGVIVQNAEELAEGHPGYVGLVTGVAREEVYIRATDRPTSRPERLRAQRYLDLFLRRSRLVLTIDYASRPELVCAAYRLSLAQGYLPCVSAVGLDRLPREASCQ
jgi:cysteinyl-tRNA synthetase